jgi:UDP-N-acetylglucosamine--N-acetylmuramyl-(pentapeptide) pyrophosphoryl-undecaprenol N-acetylglucosamine transferase
MQQRLWIVSALGEEIAALFQHSTVVISRAGGVVAELAATGTCSILIPLSTASQDHQNANAAVLAKAHAVLVFDEVTQAPKELWHMVQTMVEHPEKRHDIQRSLAHYAKPEAAKTIAQLLVG